MIPDLWYKNAIFYSLDVDTFMDANGDGIGDFEGLIRRLDYLEALGVDVLWVAPFYPSPNRDNGYDVSDHYGVDPRHGSSGDFVEFTREAEARGLRVILDLVANHTSDQHRWFQHARQGRDAPYHDWYVWSDKRPPNAHKGTIFPGEQEATWTYDKAARQYFFHRFYEFQPDLNMSNPEVRTEIRRIIGYWLALDVAGFRVDALPFILEGSPPPLDAEQRPLHFEYLTEMRQFLQWRRGDAILLAEANVPPGGMKPYFGSAGDGVHMMFNFWVNQHLFLSLATGDARPLANALRSTRSIPELSQWAHFLRNHDELDLGRLTDEERQTVFARYAPEERMRLFGRGIRRRLAPMLGDRRQEQLAYSVMFALPGTPVLRYGDEIGMGDDLSLDGRTAVRTPMQWTDGPQAGFSTAERLVHPVIDDPVWGYQRINVEAQRRDPDSLLRWMMRMIRLRKECPEIGWGQWTILGTGTTDTLAMRYDWRGNSVLVVHNFADRPRALRIRPGVEGGERLADLIVERTITADADGTHRITLDAYGYCWFRVGGMNYALRKQRG